MSFNWASRRQLLSITMYWPTGLPSVYNQELPLDRGRVSHDGLDAIHEEEPMSEPASEQQPDTALPVESSQSPQVTEQQNVPLKPAAQHSRVPSTTNQNGLLASSEVDDGAIISARCSRTGHIFATITATSLTIWQAKVCNETWPIPK